MNGNTIDRIARFLEREEDKLPERVSNSMILIALREERDARQRQIGEVLAQLQLVLEILHGKPGAGRDGLVQQTARLEHFRKLVVWALTAVLLAFLGGLGMYLFGWVVR
jgi:hypothetical protein